MKILITGGPTREPIDAVRFISNRSSGATAMALAFASVKAGHQTTLLLGPTGTTPVSLPKKSPAADHRSLETHQAIPQPYHLYRFETSAQLKQLLDAHWRDHDVLIMAAAVSDYRLNRVVDGKMPRLSGQELTLKLQPTPDLVALMAGKKRPDQRIIAFALEAAQGIEQKAIDKMTRKCVDAIVANPLGTMESDSITPVWLSRHGDRSVPGRMTKPQFADWLIDKLDSLYNAPVRSD